MTIAPFIFMSSLLFLLGLYIVCTRTNAIGYLLGIELMLNAANVNFAAFAKFHGHRIDGQVFAIFVIALAACESVIALAIVLGMYRQYRSIGTENAEELKG
jgi:NADH-quinone oxidoreductase subunit K